MPTDDAPEAKLSTLGLRVDVWFTNGDYLMLQTDYATEEDLLKALAEGVVIGTKAASANVDPNRRGRTRLIPTGNVAVMEVVE